MVHAPRMSDQTSITCPSCELPVAKIHALGVCRSCYHRQRYQANKPHYKAIYQKYKDATREERNARVRADRKINPEKYAASRRRENPLKRRNAELKSMYGEEIDRNRALHPDWFATPSAASEHGAYIDWYHLMLARQNGTCAARGCNATHSKRGGKVLPLSVDHDHSTGMIRGLLCSVCNLTLGAVFDQVDRLEGLADYLRASQTKAVAG